MARNNRATHPPKQPLQSPVSRTDPRLEQLERYFAEHDPDILAAVAEVDQPLLHWSCSLSPIERLRAGTRAAATLARLRHAAANR